LKLFEVPIEVAESKAIQMRDELGIEPEWEKTKMILNPLMIVMAHADGNNKTMIYTNAHAGKRDSTVVLLSYQKFCDMWRDSLGN
jgi:hypothetical protein